MYGLGEKTGDLDKRGRYRGGYAYAMWNPTPTSTTPPIPSTSPCPSSWCCARAARTASSSTTRSAPRSTSARRTRDAPRLRRGGRRSRLLLHRRAHAQGRRAALHGAHRPHAAAPDVGPRLPAVPVQLLPGGAGPATSPRHLPAQARSRGRRLARRPLPGGATTRSPGTAIASPIPRAWCATCARRASAWSPSSIPTPGPSRDGPCTRAAWPRTRFVKNPDGLPLQGPRLAVAARSAAPGPSVFPDFTKRLRPRVVGRLSSRRAVRGPWGWPASGTT